jgi:hypothetical protein
LVAAGNSRLSGANAMLAVAAFRMCFRGAQGRGCGGAVAACVVIQPAV